MSLPSRVPISHPQTLQLPESLRLYLGSTISNFEPGSITLLEGDRKSIRELHQELLRVMVHAVMGQWQIKLIDISNFFDPTVLSRLAFEENVNSNYVLEKISLGHPFQISQFASLIQQLHEDVLKQPFTPPLASFLIIVTGISMQLLFREQVSGDENFSARQLELLRHSIKILQELALSGATVLLIEQSEFDSPLPKHLSKNTSQDHQDSSFAIFSKVYVSVKQTGSTRTVVLKTHPYKSEFTVNIPIL